MWFYAFISSLSSFPNIVALICEITEFGIHFFSHSFISSHKDNSPENIIIVWPLMVWNYAALPRPTTICFPRRCASYHPGIMTCVIVNCDFSSSYHCNHEFVEEQISCILILHHHPEKENFREESRTSPKSSIISLIFNYKLCDEIIIRILQSVTLFAYKMFHRHDPCHVPMPLCC